ncbi:MAG: hypothetical protein CVU78_07530, partial [Elusimicrobia bacterium HGW-Elusimicrobia-2]
MRSNKTTSGRALSFDRIALVAIGGGNNAPNAPDLGPTVKTGQFQSDGTTNIAVGGEASSTTVKLSAMISDPDSNTVKLEVEIKPTGTAFTNTANYTGSLVASGSTQTLTVSGLTEGVTYHWQARTVDSNAAASAWTAFNGSDGNHFIVFRTPPADVTSFTATPGNTQATLGWTDPGDADLDKILIVRNETGSFTAPSDGTAYTDGAGTGPGGDWCENVAKAAQTLLVTSLVNGTKYYFKAYAYDTVKNYAVGASTNVTPAAVNTAPTAPSALSPAADTWIGDTTPTLSFTTDDPDNDNVKFYLQISSFSDFSTNAVYYMSHFAAECSTSFTVGQAAAAGGEYKTGAESQTLGEDDGYYWRVWLEDENGAFSSTTTANTGSIAFKIDKTTPTNVGCATPANNAVDVSPSVSLTALTAADSVSGGVQYYFEVDEVATFNSGALANSGWQGGTSWSPALSDSTTYYWRVKAQDAAGNTSVTCGHTADTADYGKFVTEIVISTANLMTDGDHDWGFEATNGCGVFWSTNTASGPPVYHYTSQKYERTASFTWPTVTTNFTGRYISLVNFVTGLTPSTMYNISCYWMSTSATYFADQRLQLEIEWFNSSDTSLGTATSGEFSLSAQNAWELKISTHTSPVNTAKAKIKIYSKHSGSSGRQCIDAVSLHNVGNVAPNAPTLTSPADNASTNDTSPAFTWTFSDPNLGDSQSAYQWVADDDSGFGSPNYNSGKTVTSYSSHTLTMATGTWYWKVKTWDADDVEGSYAAYRTLIIDTTPPGAVGDLAATAAGSNIEITWTAAVDADIDHQVLYRATFTITNQYAANVTVLSNSLVPTAGSYTDPAVNFGTTYYYVITAFDEAKNESGISNCPWATPASIGSARLMGTDYYCEPIFTPGDNTFDGTWKPYMNQRLCALINSAQSKCYVAIYNLTDDDPAGNSITDSLIARASALGAGNVKAITDQKNNDSAAIITLKEAGITVKDDGTAYPECHNKFAVIDGKYVWTGSANWTSGGGFDRQDNDVIIIQDETVALAYENQFLDMFNLGKFHTASTRNGSKDVSGKNVEFYFTASNAIKDTSFGLRNKVQNAAESCIGAIYTFTDSDAPSLEDDLETARSAGKVVRIVLDRDQIPASSPYSDLDGLGMNVRPDNNANIMHSKLMVIDQEIVATGSMNWTQVAGGASSDPNDENYLFIHDDILARQYIRYLMRLHELASDEDTTENPAADTTEPDAVSNVYAYGSGAGQITVEFDASADPNFSRYYIFISTLQNHANAMAVKQKFIDTSQTHLSDACDNDGDKAVDEEIFNGLDDDGDGLFDEDINILAEKVVKVKGEGTVQIELQTYSHGRPLDNNTTYWVCVLQTDTWGNESPASFVDASEPTVGDSFYGYVSPGVPVPNTAPVCLVASPSGWNGGAFDISATAWDNDSAYADSVISVEFQYSTASASGPWLYAGTEYLDTPIPAPSTGTCTYTWNSASYITQDSTVWLRARAKDNNLHKYSDWSVSSGFRVDNQPPPAPSPDDGIVASGSNWTQVNNPEMSWAAATDPGSGLHATEPYLVRYDTGTAAAQSGLTYTKTLSDGSHIFYAAAKDAVGNISAYGNHSVNVDNTPPPATTVTDPPVVEFDRITIEWDSVTDATSGVLHYNVYRDVADIVSVAALTPIAYPTTTTYTDDSGLAEGVEYFYVVCAFDKAGNEAGISNCVSGTAAAPAVTASIWHIPSSTAVVAGGHTYRDPAYEVHKGTRVYFYSKSAKAAATQSGLTLYWGTDGASYSSAAGQYESSDASYDFWYATATITQSGGTTFYYYLAADYSAGADRTYLYDLYSNDDSSTSAFVVDAVSKPFKLFIINTPPPEPSLTSPNGGEELFAGDVWTIIWSTVTDPDGDTLYYDIDYSVDGGVSWNGITGSAQGSSYAWTVENTPYAGALMRIRAYDGMDYSDFDESDSTFTITAVTTDHIVISEVCVGYGGASVDYVELYNPTTYQWTLDGRMDLYYENDPSVSKRTLTFSNSDIQSNGFFLIATAGETPQGVSPDCTMGTAFISGNFGIQIRYDSVIIDKAAWGSTGNAGLDLCTETTRISELKDIKSNWSMERKAYPNSTAESMAPGGADNNKGNAVDTNDNSADFVVHQDTNSFTPQNSLSAHEPPLNTSAPTLAGGTVSPAKGTTATSFSFSVNYTDSGNDRPTIAKVYIDGDAGHPMGSTDEVYNNGSIHTYATTLSAGAHEYYFYFSDGKYYVRYPAD